MGIPHGLLNRHAVRVLGLLWAVFVPVLAQADGVRERQQVVFGDLNLETAVREAISRPTGEIRPTDVSGLRWLDAADRSVVDLTGIEHFTSLSQLDLADNQIQDLSPFLGLTAAQQAARDADFDGSGMVGFPDFSLFAEAFGSEDSRYDLNGNGRVDFSDFERFARAFGRPVLIVLNLSGNQIRDLSPIAKLTSLINLDLSNNQIGDVSPLMDLELLIDLNLENNPFSDISALKHLTSLRRLNLGMGCRATGCHPEAPNTRFKPAVGGPFHPWVQGEK